MLGVVTARWERNPQIPEPPRTPHLTSDRPAWWSWVLPRAQPPARRSAMPRRRQREPKDARGKAKLAVASAGFRLPNGRKWRCKSQSCLTHKVVIYDGYPTARASETRPIRAGGRGREKVALASHHGEVASRGRARWRSWFWLGAVHAKPPRAKTHAIGRFSFNKHG